MVSTVASCCGGEYESSKIIHELSSDFILEPFGFGQFRVKSPVTYFYLSESVDMDVATALELVDFTCRLAEMHKASQSPTGKYGSHVTTGKTGGPYSTATCLWASAKWT